MVQSNQCKLYDEHGARKLIPMSLAWFRRRRILGMSPPFVRIGRRVFYREDDLLMFIESHRLGADR